MGDTFAFIIIVILAYVAVAWHQLDAEATLAKREVKLFTDLARSFETIGLEHEAQLSNLIATRAQEWLNLNMFHRWMEVHVNPRPRVYDLIEEMKKRI